MLEVSVETCLLNWKVLKFTVKTFRIKRKKISKEVFARTQSFLRLRMLLWEIPNLNAEVITSYASSEKLVLSRPSRVSLVRWTRIAKTNTLMFEPPVHYHVGRWAEGSERDRETSFCRLKALSSQTLYLKECEESFAAFCKARWNTIDPKRLLKCFSSDRYTPAKLVLATVSKTCDHVTANIFGRQFTAQLL